MTVTLPAALFTSTAWSPRRLAWSAALGMAIIGAVLSFLRVRHLLAWSLDLGFYVQDLYAIRSGLSANTIHGFGVFSDHVSPILIPLAWLVPSAAPGETLVILQALAVGLATVPMTLLGQKVAGRRGAVLACLWYVGSAAVWHALMFDFHPVTLALPFGAWILLELARGAEGRPWLPLLAMPLIREDVAILYGLVVLIAGVRSRRKALSIAGSLSVAVGAAYLVLMRTQPGIGNHVWYRFRAGSLSEILLRPLRVDVLIGLVAVLLPLLVLPAVRGWKQSWPGLLLLASFVFSSWSAQTSLYYQYYAQAVPFLIAGAAPSFNLPSWVKRQRLSILATILIFAVLGPMFFIGFGLPDRYASVIYQDRDRASARSMLASIPDDASVSATELVGPPLAWRSHIHPFPGPIMCGNSLGYHVASTTAVQYVVIEPTTAPEGMDWEIALAEWGYARLDERAGIQLWRLTDDRVPRDVCPTWEQQKIAAFGN